MRSAGNNTLLAQCVGLRRVRTEKLNRVHVPFALCSTCEIRLVKVWLVAALNPDHTKGVGTVRWTGVALFHPLKSICLHNRRCGGCCSCREVGAASAFDVVWRIVRTAPFALCSTCEFRFSQSVACGRPEPRSHERRRHDALSALEWRSLVFIAQADLRTEHEMRWLLQLSISGGSVRAGQP